MIVAMSLWLSKPYDPPKVLDIKAGNRGIWIWRPDDGVTG